MCSIAIIGNVSIVHSMYSDGRELTFVGGAAFHIGLAVAMNGTDVGIISLIGEDLAWIKSTDLPQGLDLQLVSVRTGLSSRFLINYGHDENVVGISSEYGVAADLTEHAISMIGRHKAYHICCRRPLSPSLILMALTRMSIPFTVDFFVSSAGEMISDSLPYLSSAEAVFVNAREMAILSEKLDTQTLKCIVVSNGSQPLEVFRYGVCAATAIPRSVIAKEVTGAGDTIVGSFLSSWEQGLDDQSAAAGAVEFATSSLDAPFLSVSVETQ